MTKRRFDSVLDEIFAAVAEAHELNTISEQKHGDLGEVMGLAARAIQSLKYDIVRKTSPAKPLAIVSESELGPVLAAEANTGTVGLGY